MLKLIIFDIDGTLVDAYNAIRESLNYTLRKAGYKKDVSIYTVRRSVGLGDKNFIKRFVKEKDVKRALAVYRRRHPKDILKYSRRMPDSRRVLAFLKKRGFALAIASNRPRKYSHILLEHLGLKRYFDKIVCAGNKEEIKPNPKLLFDIMHKLDAGRDETIYIGDMVIDVMAGRNAGVRTMAVMGGSSSAAELKRARPYKIISRLSLLPEIISALN
jgi:HAD superfamily hydrolase (TIGR01549 family)